MRVRFRSRRPSLFLLPLLLPLLLLLPLADLALADQDRAGNATTAPQGLTPGGTVQTGSRQILTTDGGTQIVTETAYGQVVTTQTSLTTTPTRVDTGLAGRLALLVQNNGSAAIWCAGAATLPDAGALTSSLGTFQVAAGERLPLGWAAGIPLYCLASTGTVAVAVVEVN